MSITRRLVVIVLTASVALIVVGIAAVAISLTTPVTFGWFAYQPLADAAFVPGLGLISASALLWSAAISIGMLGIGFAVGWLVGTRADRTGAVNPE